MNHPCRCTQHRLKTGDDTVDRSEDQLETKYIATKAVQYCQEDMSVITSLVLLQGVAKTQQYIQEISKKSHLEFSSYIMPPPGGKIENFYMFAQLHSF